jgi:serine/threonine protein kinase
MTPERWQQVREVLQGAMQLEPVQRLAYLEQHCSNDPSLRRDVDSILAVEHELGASFLESPAIAHVIPDQNTAASANWKPGMKLGPYEIQSLLGAGGMGEVYRARDTRLDRTVALKVLPALLSSDPARKQRLEREARAIAALQHPNICTLHDVGQQQGVDYLVMEYLEGETLAERLTKGPLPLKQILRFGVEITDALDAAHRRGIVHRDLKPGNIFLTTHGECKVLDFGLAKLDESHDEQEAMSTLTATEASEKTLTTPGLVIGTVAYMSPEQIRGALLDARTDIFSFGLVLYEMAAGQRAFTGETEAILHDVIQYRDPKPVREINPELAPEVESIISKALEKDRERRYQSAAEMSAELKALANRPGESEIGRLRIRGRWQWLASAALICVLLVAGGLYWHSRRAPKATEQDTIVIADFENRTGDPVFDDTLNQALSAQLSQSPFLNLLPNLTDRGVLKELKLSANEPLTEEVAREVCQHAGSKGVVTGSLGALGNKYMLGLKIKDCYTGNILAEAQEQAEGKEAVLKALDEAATSIRKQIGEPLSSVQKYSVPLAEATTSSLEAWKAYSMGETTRYKKGGTAGLPLFLRAVEIDPNFAKAYSAISVAYGDDNKTELSQEYARKAYELRDKVSERDRFAIDAIYYEHATGDLEKAAHTYELWGRNYPKDPSPYVNLGNIYGELGCPEKKLAASREAVRLDPNEDLGYVNLATAYLDLNRLDDLEEVYKQGHQHTGWYADLDRDAYLSAFLKGDTRQMAQITAAIMGNPGWKEWLLPVQGDTEGWYGRLKKARALTEQSIDLLQHEDDDEEAAAYQVAAALREAAAGNRQLARGNAIRALKMSQAHDIKQVAALVLAQSGDIAAAEKLAYEVDKARPLDTLVQRYWLPTIRAAIALERKNPNGAIALLNGMGAIELGDTDGVYLCPVYVRGEAYLALYDGKSAAAEFQKFIDHYGLVGNFPWGALARLGMARGYALEAETDPVVRGKARAAYENFLTLWKDADPDIPILKKAKAEYAKLQ